MAYKQTKVWLEESMEIFLTHWKYWWDDYKSSTLLLDPSMRIIAFFDRGTRLITVIQSDLDYYDKVIYECLSNDEWKVKVIPHKIKESIKYIREENKNYFNNLILWMK